MRVDKSKIRTILEEYDYLYSQIMGYDEYLPWDMHPNQIRAQDIRKNRARKKLIALVDSEEGKEYRLFCV